MTTDRYPIGKSSYDDGTRTTPRGRMQTVNSAWLAAQLRSAALEFDHDVLHDNGEHLTPNEGIRELDRQWELYNLHQADPGRWALAATPGYSTHGPQIGTAVDFGITRADGTNRALTPTEFSRLYPILAKRGIVHTGAWFSTPEAWHCNGIYAASVQPDYTAPLMGTTKETTDEVDEQIRRALMAAGDTLSYFQRKDTAGKAQNVYFIAGPGIFLDIVTGKVDADGKPEDPQWIVRRTGISTSKIREVLNREAVKVQTLDARDYDERRSLYAALSEAARGAAEGK